MKRKKSYTWDDFCILGVRKNWLTEGTNEQCEKLYYAFHNGADERELAYLIWICSDTGELRGDFDEQITAIEDVITKDMGD